MNFPANIRNRQNPKIVSLPPLVLYSELNDREQEIICGGSREYTGPTAVRYCGPNDMCYPGQPH